MKNKLTHFLKTAKNKIVGVLTVAFLGVLSIFQLNRQPETQARPITVVNPDRNKDNPKKEDPKKEDPKKEDPKKEDPKKEDPKKEDPKKEDPKEEDPKKEDPKEEEPETPAPEKIYYNVTFLNADGSIFVREAVLENSSATNQQIPVAPVGQLFSGWDTDLTKITQDIQVKPVFKAQNFAVKFLNHKREVVDTQSVVYGESAVAPQAIELEGYTFLKWDKDLKNITSDLEVNPVYEQIKHTITYLDENNNVISTKEVPYGEKATLEEAPDKEGHTFKEWKLSPETSSAELESLKKDITVVAVYEKETVTITFLNHKREPIPESTLSFEYGASLKDVVFPAQPDLLGYHELGWDLSELASLTTLQKNVVITPKYSIKEFKVRLVDSEQNLLKEVVVQEGQPLQEKDFPKYEGKSLVVLPTENPILEDQTIELTYEINRLYIRYLNYEGYVQFEDTLFYGETIPEYNVSLLPREGYDFIGWEASHVLGDIAKPTQYEESAFFKPLYQIQTFEVTYVDRNNNVLATETVEWNQGVREVPLAPQVEGYTFVGWSSPLPKNVKSTMTLKAEYEINVYEVTFVDKDGNVVDKQSIEHGKSATYPKEPEAPEGLVSLGWDQPIDHITSHLTVKLRYEIKRHSVKFFAEDGVTLLHGERIPHGSPVVAPEAPSKQGYDFLKWEGGNLESITTNTSFVATYGRQVKEIRFEDSEGQLLKTVRVEFGKQLDQQDIPEAPQRLGYSFAGWSQPLDQPVLDNMSVQASYKIKTVKVTFQDEFGTVLSVNDLQEGKTVIFPTAPPVEGYHFVGWDSTHPGNQPVLSDVVFIANYEINRYTVTLEDLDSVQTQEVEHGQDALLPTPLNNKIGYHFTDWSNIGKNITQDITIKANYAINQYKVNFFGETGELLMTQIISHGSTANPPVLQPKEGYDFTGWGAGSFTNITGDTNFKASYKIQTRTVQFLNQAGATVKTMTVNYGDSISNQEFPTAEQVLQVGYHLVGWDTTLTSIKDNLVVKPLVEINQYKITIDAKDGTQPLVQIVAHGQPIVYPNSPDKEGYDFIGWSNKPVLATQDERIEATYKIKKLEVKFLRKNGALHSTMKVDWNQTAYTVTLPAVEGYTFKHWALEGTSTPASLNNIKADSTFVPIYELKTYSVEFVAKVVAERDLQAPLTHHPLHGTSFKKVEIAHGSQVVFNHTLKLIEVIQNPESGLSNLSFNLNAGEGYTISLTNLTNQKPSATVTVSNGNSFVIDVWAANRTVKILDNMGRSLPNGTIYTSHGLTLTPEQIQPIKQDLKGLYPENSIYEMNKIVSTDNPSVILDLDNLGVITKNLTGKATEGLKKYTLQFKDINGQILASSQVEYTKAIGVLPTAPVVVGKEFVRWTRINQSTEVTRYTQLNALNEADADGKLTIVPQYKTKEHTVTFVKENGHYVGTSKVLHGQSASLPEGYTPTYTYVYAGLSNNTNNITEATTVTVLETRDPKASAMTFNGTTYYGYFQDAMAQDVLPLLNAVRQSEGKAPLVMDPALTQFAKIRAQELFIWSKLHNPTGMAISHTRPNGSNWDTVLTDSVVRNAKGENVAGGQKSALGVHTSWTNSPGHLSNMVHSSFNKVGIAAFKGENGLIYWVQIFADK